MDKGRLIGDLLVSVSGVLIFLSLAHFIDLNGFSRFAPLIMSIGILILVFFNRLLDLLKPLRFFTKEILLTISHVLIFIGLKTYLEAYIDSYWILFFMIGVLFLNTHKKVSNFINE